MPRDANGNFTLPSGNPVVTGTTIESAWANLTMDDIRQGLTDSLDRFGRGGMQAPFRFVDGSASAPGMSWASELSTGFFRAGASNMAATVAGVPRMRWTGAGVDIWNPAGAGSWFAIPVTPLDTSNFALLNGVNVFTAAQQVIQNASGSWAIWKDSTPTLAGRLGFNISAADTLELSYFNGSAWRPRYFAGAANVQHYSTQHVFWDEPGSNRVARLAADGLSVGPATFSPVAASTTVLGAIANSGRAETGAFLNNGVNSQRASIFVTDIGGAAVGIDWVFSTNVAEFEFRRAGVTRFVYDNSAIRLLSTPAGTHRVTWQADDGGSAFWNTSAGLTGYQWYVNSALCATMGTDRTSFGRAAGTDYILSQPTAGGAISIRGDGSTTNRGLSFGTINNAGAFTALLQMGDFVPGVARFMQGLTVQIFNAGSTFSGGLNVPVGTTQAGLQYVENGTQRGGVMYHNDATFRFGGIFVSTAAAPGTGGTPGQIWLQTAT